MSASLKVMLPVVLLSTTSVPTETAPPNVAPPELVSVSKPIFVEIVRVSPKAPVVLMTKFAGQFKLVPERPVSIPETEPRLIAPEEPVPKVSVTPLPIIRLLNVMACAPKSSVELKP